MKDRLRNVPTNYIQKSKDDWNDLNNTERHWVSRSAFAAVIAFYFYLAADFDPVNKFALAWASIQFAFMLSYFVFNDRKSLGDINNRSENNTMGDTQSN